MAGHWEAGSGGLGGEVTYFWVNDDGLSPTPDQPYPGTESYESPTPGATGGVTVGSSDPPVPEPSPGRIAAKNTYMDWVRWKRKELGNLIAKYRNEYPQQIKAYEDAALGALPEAQKSMWGDMYTNLDKRGLRDSMSFVGGAKKDLESWTQSQKSKIADTKQGMEATAQQAILKALGQPDYPGLYSNWVKADDQTAAYNARLYDQYAAKNFEGPEPEYLYGP